MDRIFIIKLAFKNLFSHKMRTFLTLIGIIIGISAVIFLVAFGSGIQRLVTSQISGGDAFSLIDVGTGNSQVVKLTSDLIDKVKNTDGVNSIETVVNLGGKAKSGDKTMDITVFGISSDRYMDWSGKNVKYGKAISENSVSSTGEVAIDASFASFLTGDNPETLIGKTIDLDLILPKEISQTNESKSFADQKFVVSRIIKEETNASVYINMSDLGFTNIQLASQLKVKVDNRSDVDSVRKKVEAYGLKSEYVGDTVTQVEQFFNTFKIILGSFGLIALIVALLGMFNTLTISLLERIKEVALMKIFGMGKKDIINLFLTEAVVFGFIGGIIGIVWGIFIGKVANFILNTLATRSGGEAVNVFYFSPGLLIGTMVAAIVIGLVTGLYPANRAKRLNALDVLRYE